MNNHELLTLKHLSKTYADGEIKALVDISLSIYPGEYIAIMGPSGSGKSTLLHLIGGLDEPNSGQISFRGQFYSQMKNLDALRARKIGIVFQSFYLLPVLTALENVQIPMFEMPLNTRYRSKKAEELLHTVGMGHRKNHLPNQLSVGEKQRVAIARALANDPELILADEPTGSLDSHSSREILDLFEELHRQRGVTLVVVTHDRDVAARAKRLIQLSDGAIVNDSRPKTG
jgi:putative ABC transport system ATP-binding protein